MWFQALTGFAEPAVDDVAGQFVVDGPSITSRANGRTMRVGRFEMPSLGELRGRAAGATASERAPGTRLRELVGDVRALHAIAASAGSLFQVASQFNMLEMASPSLTPEDGVDRYETDHTQGPACAIACGAGTIYRNYLVPIGAAIGQTADRQLDGLADLRAALGVEMTMRNGYALPTAAQLQQVSGAIDALDDVGRDALMAHLRIGIHWDTEVTFGDPGYTVAQAYCSALPVAYQSHATTAWEPFARLVLDAAYEATLAAAVLNAVATGNRTVHLTLLGGGAFGNPTAWIVDALSRACRLFEHADLDLAIVSYRQTNPDLAGLLATHRS